MPPRMSSPIRWRTTIHGLTPAIDWDRTIAFREHLWSLGLGVAEAMDTAQRGMGMDWTNSLELIRRSLDAAKDVPGALSPPAPGPTISNRVLASPSTTSSAPTKSNARQSRSLAAASS